MTDPARDTSGRKQMWIAILGGVLALLMCGCTSAVLLVLTGIIAEPETVIEQIVRALFGG